MNTKRTTGWIIFYSLFILLTVIECSTYVLLWEDNKSVWFYSPYWRIFFTLDAIYTIIVSIYMLKAIYSKTTHNNTLYLLITGLFPHIPYLLIRSFIGPIFILFINTTYFSFSKKIKVLYPCNFKSLKKEYIITTSLFVVFTILCIYSKWTQYDFYNAHVEYNIKTEKESDEMLTDGRIAIYVPNGIDCIKDTIEKQIFFELSQKDDSVYYYVVFSYMHDEHFFENIENEIDTFMWSKIDEEYKEMKYKKLDFIYSNMEDQYSIQRTIEFIETEEYFDCVYIYNENKHTCYFIYGFKPKDEYKGLNDIIESTIFL